METIDLTPTPLEYARIAQRMIEGAYGLDAPAGLTNYQVLWTWQAAENTAEFIRASPLADLRRGLARPTRPGRASARLASMARLRRQRIMPNQPMRHGGPGGTSPTGCGSPRGA